VNYFVDRYAKRAGKKIKHIQKKTLDIVQDYSWPGNVRELQNVIERLVIIAETNELSIDESWLATEPQTPTASMERTLTERKRIEAALAQSNGKVSGAHGAAANLGMPASTLESKIRSLKINKFQFKGAKPAKVRSVRLFANSRRIREVFGYPRLPKLHCRNFFPS